MRSVHRERDDIVAHVNSVIGIYKVATLSNPVRNLRGMQLSVLITPLEPRSPPW